MKLHYGCIPFVHFHKSMSGLLLNIHWIKAKVRFRRRPDKSKPSTKANNEENAYQTNFITDFDLYEAFIFRLHSTLKLETPFVVDTLQAESDNS